MNTRMNTLNEYTKMNTFKEKKPSGGSTSIQIIKIHFNYVDMALT